LVLAAESFMPCSLALKPENDGWGAHYATPLNRMQAVCIPFFLNLQTLKQVVLH
jgi:hypothetical protein